MTKRRQTPTGFVDIGPDGGELVASGRPEDVVAEKRSYTGRFLKELLERHPRGRKREAAE